ncbi:MAG: hypothetical protein K2K05_09415, partial [Muribaculaceae bacterium]|nr:hypothetical protein [Muribaculaceae bacterium]
MKLSGLAKLVKVVKVVRSVLMILVFMVIAIPVALYITLSSDWAQNKLCAIGASELSALLDTRVEIGEVSYSPFNRLRISDVAIADDKGETAATISSLDTRVEFWDLIFNKKIIVDYASIEGLSLHLYRDSIGAPLNITRIISHLSSDDKDKPESIFRLRLNDVEIQSSSFSYDVLSEPVTPERFNPAHVAVDDISLMAFAPVVANDSYKVWLRSLSCSERSGLKLSDITAKCFISPDRLTVAGLRVELPNSLIEFADISIPIQGIKSIPSVLGKAEIPISLSDDSHISLSDLQAFVPLFSKLPYTFDISLDAVFSPLAIDLRHLHVSDYDKMFSLDAEGDVSNYRHTDSVYSELFTFSVSADSTAISSYLTAAGHDIDPKVRGLLLGLGRTSVSGNISGSARQGNLDIAASTGLADVTVEGRYRRPGNDHATEFDMIADVDSLMLGTILSNTDLHSVSAVINAKGRLARGGFTGDVNADISHIYFKGYRYSDISASAIVKSLHDITGRIDIADPAIGLHAEGAYSAVKAERCVKAGLELTHADLGLMGLSEKYADYSLSGRVSVDGSGESVDLFSGTVNVADLALKDPEGEGFILRQLDLTAD